MTFFDQFIGIGRHTIGSTLIGTGQVARINLGLSAVGSNQLGSFLLNKAIGTLHNIDIGTYTVNYGSAGTHAGGLARYRVGSFGRYAGSVGAGFVSHGSFPSARFGTFPTTKTTYGTFGVARLPSLGGGYIGTLANARLTRSPAFGSVSAAGQISAGPFTSPTAGFILASGAGGAFLLLDRAETRYHQDKAGSLWVLFATSGSLKLQSLNDLWVWGQTGILQKGSIPAARLNLGTMLAARLPSLGGAYVGTLAAARIQLLQNLAGSLQGAHLGTFGLGKVAYGTLGQPMKTGLFNGTIQKHLSSNATYGWGVVVKAGTIQWELHKITAGVDSVALRVQNTAGATIDVVGSFTAPNMGQKVSTGTLLRPVVAAYGSLARHVAGSASIRRFTGTISASGVTGSWVGIGRADDSGKPALVLRAGTTWYIDNLNGTMRFVTPGQQHGLFKLGRGQWLGSWLGNVGSFGRYAGSIGAQFTSYGTFAQARIPALTTGTQGQHRLYQYVGTRLAGTQTTAKTNYCVWPVPFANATYRPVVTPGWRITAGVPQVVAAQRTAGSMAYTINNSLTNSAVGSLHFMAFPNN